MIEVTATCQKCGAEITVKTKGNTVILICPNCDEDEEIIT